MEFEWNDAKAATNVSKHGITFEEAATVFGDPLALIFEDPVHSVDEHRELIIGHSTAGHLIIVAFVERKESVRIISARQATPKERRDYENNR